MPPRNADARAPERRDAEETGSDVSIDAAFGADPSNFTSRSSASLRSHLSPFYYSFLSPLLPFRRVFSRFTDLSHVPPIFPAFRLSFQEFRDLPMRVPSLSLKFQRFFLRFPNVCRDFFGAAISCHVFVVIFEARSSNGTRFSRISPNFRTIRPFSTHISIIFKRLVRFSA